MSHLQSQHHLGNLLTREGLLDSNCHTLGKLLITSQLVIIHIKEIVNLTTRNDQCMTLYQRVDIEESIELLILCTLVAGNLASSNLTENIHNGNLQFDNLQFNHFYAIEIFSIRNLMVPRGILISTSSPTFLPSRP